MTTTINTAKAESAKAHKIGEIVGYIASQYSKQGGKVAKVYKGKIIHEGEEYDAFDLVKVGKDGKKLEPFSYNMPIHMDLNEERLRKLAIKREESEKRADFIKKDIERMDELAEVVKQMEKKKHAKRTRQAKEPTAEEECYYGSDRYLEDGYEASLPSGHDNDY